MGRIGLEWTLITTPIKLQEVSTVPSGTAIIANTVQVYAKDKAGTSALYLKDDASNEREIAPSNAVTGSGVSGQVAFWTGTQTLSGDSDLTFSTDTLSATKVAIASLTLGRIPFASTVGLLIDSANLFWDNSNTRLGIGTSVPGVLVHIQSQTTGQKIQVENYNDTFATILNFRTAKNTLASPTAVTADFGLGRIAFSGYQATTGAFGNQNAIIQAQAAETFTNAAQGTYLTLHTTATGTTSVTERFRVGPAGQWGIGGATFGSTGNVFLSGGASAAPTWGSHDSITGLTSGDGHTQYALLAGRSGGQTLKGGTAASENLTLQSTSNATKGSVLFGSIAAVDEANTNLLIGTTTRSANTGRVLVSGTITNNNSGQSAIALSNTFDGSAGGGAGEMYCCFMGPTFSPSGSIAFAGGFRADVNFSPGASVTITDAQAGRLIAITGSTAGAITSLAGLQLLPSYGSLKPTNAYGLDVLNFGSASITKAVGIRIIKPTAATNNYYMELDTADGTDPTGGGGAANGRIPILVGGTLRYLAYY